GKPNIHTRRISLNRGFQDSSDVCEFDDLIELGGDLRPAHSQYGTVQIDVFDAIKFRMKSRAHFEQAADAPSQDGFAGIRLRNRCQQLQERGLARAITAYDSTNASRGHGKSHILKRVEFIARNLRLMATTTAQEPLELITQRTSTDRATTITLG